MVAQKFSKWGGVKYRRKFFFNILSQQLCFIWLKKNWYKFIKIFCLCYFSVVHSYTTEIRSEEMAFISTLTAFTSTLMAFTSTLTAFTGTLMAFASTLRAFTGTHMAFTSTLTAFTGTLRVFTSTLIAFTSTLMAFASTLAASTELSSLSGLALTQSLLKLSPQNSKFCEI